MPFHAAVPTNTGVRGAGVEHETNAPQRSAAHEHDRGLLPVVVATAVVAVVAAAVAAAVVAAAVAATVAALLHEG